MLHYIFYIFIKCKNVVLYMWFIMCMFFVVGSCLVCNLRRMAEYESIDTDVNNHISGTFIGIY